MKIREVLIGILLETDATIAQLNRVYIATICDKLTLAGKYGRINSATVMPVKRGKRT